MLTWSFFQRRFGGDPSIVGKTVPTDLKAYTIVGVLPKWFVYPDARSQLWVPYADGKTAEKLGEHDNHYPLVVARMKPGVSLKTATEEVSALQYRMHMEYVGRPVAEDAMSRPMIDDLVEDEDSTADDDGGGSVHAADRMPECLKPACALAARHGRRRWRFAGLWSRADCSAARADDGDDASLRDLGRAGPAVGVGGDGMAEGALAWAAAGRVGSCRRSHRSVYFRRHLRGRCSCRPAASPVVDAKGDSWSAEGFIAVRGRSVSRARLRKVLLSVEIALTVVLLIAAGLLLKSFVQLRTTDLGIPGDHVLTVAYSLPKDQYSKPEQNITFSESLLERVRRIPGVESAGMGSTVPGAGWDGDQVFIIPERPNYESNKQPDAMTRYADPAYFKTLGIPLIAGRVFTEHDRLDQSNKVIVTEELVKRYYPNESVIGRTIVMGTEITNKKRTYEIVGVVGNTLWRVGEQTKATTYFPVLSGDNTYRRTLVVHTSGDPLTYAIPIQKEIAALDPRLPVVDVLTIPQIVGESTVNQSLTTSLVLAFAALSLILAGVGLYGVLSYVVTQRVTEIGIRMALGAQRGQVLGMVLRDGMGPVVAGLAVGVAGGVAVGYVIRSLLYGTKPMDPMVFVVMVATLLLVAAMASAAPAWRASSVNPIEALRTE